MTTDTEQKVVEWIDRRQDYLTDFLRNLIAIPSVTGEELEIQKFIAHKLESMGLEVDGNQITRSLKPTLPIFPQIGGTRIGRTSWEDIEAQEGEGRFFSMAM